MTIIDRVTVHLNLKYDEYEAEFSNLGLGGVYQSVTNTPQSMIVYCAVEFGALFSLSTITTIMPLRLS